MTPNDYPHDKKFKMESNKPKGIIDGFDHDFNQICHEYSSSYPNLGLTEFFNYWISKKLDLLFVNRYDPRELLESISEMNKYLVSRLMNDNGATNYWLVAIYMMLCIFVKQPQRLKRKFRMKMEDLIYVEKLIEAKKTLFQDSCGPTFAWKCLKNLDAIELVEERNICGPQILKKGGNKEYHDYDELATRTDPLVTIKKDSKVFLETKIEPSLLEIESLLAPYESIKKSLQLDPSGNDPITTSYIKQAKELIEKFKADIENPQEKQQRFEH